MITQSFVFPGQGSQHIGMLKDLGAEYPVVNDVFGQVSDAVGIDIWSLIQSGPESQLNQTEHTQVAMLTSDVAIYRILQEKGFGDCKFMAGHSLGEYAALVCSQAIKLTDAALLVAKRGQLMQQSIPLGLGAMAAIVGLSDEQVAQICEQASTSEEHVTPANYNAIGQVVIAGHTPAVERANQMALNSNALLAKIIPVSVPCHCPLLIDAAEQFEEHLESTDIQTPEVSVISNVTASVYESGQQIRALLKEQLYRPVRWVETIQYMKAKGVNLIIECGPGQVLTGLTKRIDRDLKAMSTTDTTQLEKLLNYLQSEG